VLRYLDALKENVRILASTRIRWKLSHARCCRMWWRPASGPGRCRLPQGLRFESPSAIRLGDLTDSAERTASNIDW